MSMWFRSRKEKGGDKMHDYFYHNLGQTLTLTAADGTDLNLQPTEELAFARRASLRLFLFI